MLNVDKDWLETRWVLRVTHSYPRNPTKGREITPSSDLFNTALSEGGVWGGITVQVLGGGGSGWLQPVESDNIAFLLMPHRRPGSRIWRGWLHFCRSATLEREIVIIESEIINPRWYARILSAEGMQRIDSSKCILEFLYKTLGLLTLFLRLFIHLFILRRESLKWRNTKYVIIRNNIIVSNTII